MRCNSSGSSSRRKAMATRRKCEDFRVQPMRLSNIAYTIAMDVNNTLGATNIMDEPEAAELELRLGQACAILDKLKRVMHKKKDDFMAKTLATYGVAYKVDSSSSDDEVFTHNAPDDGDEDGDKGGEKVRGEKQKPRSLLLSYSGFHDRRQDHEPYEVRDLPKDEKLDEDPDATYLREIFYSASTEEEVNGPVQDVEARIDEDAKRNKDGDCAMPKAGPSEDADESDDSAKVTYEGRQLGEVITLSSDEESPVDIMSEPEEPDTEGSLDSNSEVPSGTVDLADSSHEESFGNESEVHASDYDTESVDMEKMEANEVENFSIDDLYN